MLCQLSYTHRRICADADGHTASTVARQKGFEPLTRGLEGRCSVLLSYWREIIGASRFERPTPCSQGRCATRLRHAPSLYGLTYPCDRNNNTRNRRHDFSLRQRFPVPTPGGLDCKHGRCGRISRKVKQTLDFQTLDRLGRGFSFAFRKST